MANECSNCGTPPGPGNVTRMVGRDGAGNITELCFRCWKLQKRDEAPAEPQLKKKGKGKRAHS